MNDNEAYICGEFGKHIDYVVTKYYKKVSNPSIINETLFAIAAQILSLYSSEDRDKIYAQLQDISKQPLVDPTKGR